MCRSLTRTRLRAVEITAAVLAAVFGLFLPIFILNNRVSCYFYWGLSFTKSLEDIVLILTITLEGFLGPKLLRGGWERHPGSECADTSIPQGTSIP